MTSECFQAFMRALPAELRQRLGSVLAQAMEQAKTQQEQAARQLSSFRAAKEACEQARRALMEQRQALQAILDRLPLSEFWHCMEARMLEAQLKREIQALDEAIAEQDRKLAQAQAMLHLVGAMEAQSARRRQELSGWLERMGLGA